MSTEKLISVYIVVVKGVGVYVGITINCKRRFRIHLRSRRFREYDISELEFSVIAECNGYREARRLEKLIKNNGVNHFYQRHRQGKTLRSLASLARY